jgi:DNA-binding SARP family transcriptional activator/TolB-like protein
LVTLGDLRLTDTSGRTVPYPEKGLIALCYLLTTKSHERSRADLATFLWENVDASRASANLRTLLSRVRNQQVELGVELLIARETTVAINLDGFESDLCFIERANEGSVEHRLAAFLRHCQGPFLAGADELSDRGRDWVTAKRESIVEQFSEILDKAVTTDIDALQTLIREGAHRLLQIDPQCEAAYRVLMKVHAAGGQLNAARATYERLKDRLWHELKAVPEQSTVDLIRGMSPLQLQARPVEVPHREGTEPLPTRISHLPRIALLPPVDVSKLSLLPGLIDDLTLGLCSVKTISMIAPHTAERISTDPDRGAAYERHAIAYALDTRVSKNGGRETLFAQLVDVRSDVIVWAERFDADTQSLPDQYQTMARRIAGSVAGGVEDREIERLGAHQHPNAYQYYLMGQRFLKRIDLPDVRRARKAFRLSVKEDPRFSAAFAGLARTDHMEWLLTARGDAALLRSSQLFAEDAIRMREDGAAGYRELGVAKLFGHQFDESIEAFEKAEAASPWHADLIADYADTLIHSSDPVRGLAKIELAIELNPLSPDVYHWTAAGANYCLERFEEALACLARMDDQSHISRVAAACWGMLGDRKKAHAYKRKTLATHPNFDVETWLSIMPVREQWQKDQYREGLRKAGF